MSKNGTIPKIFSPKTESKEIKKIIVHGGRFDIDELMCIAIVKEFENNDVEVIRVNHYDIDDYIAENDIDNSTDTIVCDCGMKFDGHIYFDHHQCQKLGSAASLLWFTCGNQLYGRVNKLIRDVGAHDSSYTNYRNIAYSAFGYMCSDDEQENDKNFRIALSMVIQLLRACVKQDIECFKKFNEIRPKETIMMDGTVCVLPIDVGQNVYLSNAYMYILRNTEYERCKDVKVIASYDKSKEIYTCITTSGYRFPNESSLPKTVKIKGRQFTCDSTGLNKIIPLLKKEFNDD